MPDGAGRSRDNSVSPDAGTTQAIGRQSFVAIVVGLIVFTTVMLLIALAVIKASPSVSTYASSQPAGKSVADYAHYIVVEDFLARVMTGAHGYRELELVGKVRNTGDSPVKAATIRCCFRTASGGEAIFELPLVVDTRVATVSNGWLMPLTGRAFSVRIGRFPEGIEEEPLYIEVTRVSTQKL